MAQHTHGQGIQLKYLAPRGERKRGVDRCGMKFFPSEFLLLVSHSLFHSFIPIPHFLKYIPTLSGTY